MLRSAAGSVNILYSAMYGQHAQESMDQPGMVTNSARNLLKTETIFFPVPICA